MQSIGKNVIEELRKCKLTEIEMQVLDYFRKSVQAFRRKKKQFAWNPEGEGKRLYYWIYSYAIANHFGISSSFAKYVMDGLCEKGILKKKVKKSCGLTYYQKTDLYFKIFGEIEKGKCVSYPGVILENSPSIELRNKIKNDTSHKKTVVYNSFDYQQVKQIKHVKLREINLYKELLTKISRLDFQQNSFNYKGNMFFTILPANLCKSLGMENNRSNRKKINRMLVNLEKAGMLKTIHICYFKEAGVVKVVDDNPSYKKFDNYETFNVTPNETQQNWLETYKNLNLICLSYNAELAQEWNNPSSRMEQPQLKNGTHSYNIISDNIAKVSSTDKSAETTNTIIDLAKIIRNQEEKRGIFNLPESCASQVPAIGQKEIV